jgi:HK97 family phage portal protein
MSLRERLAAWLGKSEGEGEVEAPAAPANGAGSGATSGVGAANVTSPPWGGWPYGGGAGAAENVATLCACVDVIASAIASLPALVYETMPDGERRETADHPVAQLIAEPNSLQSWSDVVRFFMSSVLLAGNALVEVQRNGNGQPTALLPIMWSNAQPTLVPAPPGQAVGPLAPGGRLAFDILRTVAPFGGTGTPRRMFADNGELFFLRERSNTGVLGVSRLMRAPMVLQQALSVQAFATYLWDNAGTPSLVFSHPGKLSAEASTRISQSWRDSHAGPLNARKAVVVEEGMEVKPISANAEDNQVLDSRQFAAEEIARLYGVPPPLVGIWRFSSFTNSQQANSWFGQNTLRPWCRAIEREFARSVFADPRRFCLELDLSGLLRGDFASQVTAGVNLVRAGILSQDELREELGYNRRGGDADQLRPQAIGGRPDGVADGEGSTLPAPGAPTNGTGRNGAAL